MSNKMIIWTKIGQKFGEKRPCLTNHMIMINFIYIAEFAGPISSDGH